MSDHVATSTLHAECFLGALQALACGNTAKSSARGVWRSLRAAIFAERLALAEDH
jgi:hypothetical protein